jgi:hypothetical protein
MENAIEQLGEYPKVIVKRLTCECGIEFVPANYYIHIHTKTHIQNMKIKYRYLNIQIL